MTDDVNNPVHYTMQVPGVECIDVTQHFDFLRGNAIKYIWRAGIKGDSEDDEIKDLRKAIWYLERALQQMEE